MTTVNPYPVDSGNVTMGDGIPAADLDALIARTSTATETEVVDLDDPDPAAVRRWNQLAEDSESAYLHHGGDAEKIIPFPRPSWCDPDEDFIGDGLAGCGYQSAITRIPVANSKGEDDGTYCRRATVDVSAGIFGVGNPAVFMNVRKKTDAGRWTAVGPTLNAAEARQLAQALLAAADLIGGAK